MSLQRSVGDLVPQDIAEILARERHGIKARKHRGGSLGRAFRWLKARRKRKRMAGGSTNGTAGLGDGRAGKASHQHGHDVAKGLHKQEEEVRPCLSPLYPENVFIEGDRPQFLQDLHTEAQEGLKIQLLEENGMDYQDDESMVSTATLQTGEHASLADSMRTLGSALTTTATTDAMSTVSVDTAASEVSAASTVSTRSSVRSTRSGLTRQASTFKPLSGSKRPEKSRRRSKRATVAGIPQHVKRELGLDRGPWPTSPTEGRLPNGEGVVLPMEEVDALPDPGGTPEGVRVHLEALEVLQSAEEQEQQLQRHHKQAQYLDGLAMARSAGPRLSPRRRPRSVLVPGLPARAVIPAEPPASGDGSPSDGCPPSPVMYVSPQATYLSKIIPNAVLPGDVDVIEISRKGRSRGSVRTLSRSSLTAPSPTLSRASWAGSGSDSDSSHTVVSDNSTISSGGGRGRSRREKPESRAQGVMVSPTSPDRMSLHSSVSCASNISSVSQQGGGSPCWAGDAPFGRNLSVKKSKKHPPAPPRRTNSLHPGKLRRRSRDVLDSPVQSPSPAYSADQSSSASSTVSGLPFPAQTAGMHRTLSPSSGYSSQNPTPTVSPYSGNPQPAYPGSHALRKVSPLLSAFLGYGAPPDIPPHPKVKAPTPPPPETWIHDQRSFDLLIGPVAVRRNLFVALQKVRLERQRKSAPEPTQRPPVAGGVQKKEPPPVMKKIGLGKMEALMHAIPTVMVKQTPPPSPPPSHNPPPPPAPAYLSGPPRPSETDSSWPLPPPPPVEILPVPVFEGQDEADFLPPPPLQDGVGSPPVPPLVMATPTQKVAAPATIVTAAMVTVPSEVQPSPSTPQPSRTKNSPEPPLLQKEVPPLAQETLYVLQGIPPPPKEPPPPPPEATPVVQQVPSPIQKVLPPPAVPLSASQEIPPPPQEAPPPPPVAPPVSQEVPPPVQVTLYASQEIPPPPQGAPPPPPVAPTVPQEVLPPPQEVPPVPQEVLPLPQEVPPVPQEVLPPPQEVPSAPQEVLPPPQEVPPVPQEVLSPPQEALPVSQEVLPPVQEVPPVPQEVLPSPQEVTPVPQEVLPPPQEVPIVPQEALLAPPEVIHLPQEVLPPTKEAPPVPQEVLPPTKEGPPVSQEVLPPSQEAPPVPEEVLAPPQEVAPVSQEVLPPTQEAPPAPEEVRTSVLTVPTVVPPPPPVEEQTPPPDPANQEAPVSEPQPKSSPTPHREARVPMTTSALLQMVRMRASEPREAWEKPGQNQNQNQNQAEEQSTAQRPDRSKYAPHSPGLMEAVRMKTAAMSRVSPCHSPRSASPSPSPSPSSPSLASTASFIFAKSNRKVVIETPSSPKERGRLRAHLATELARISANDQKKPVKVPPPVAKKPGHHTPNDQDTPTTPTTPAAAANGGGIPTGEEQPQENRESPNGSPGGAQPANTGQMSVSP